MIRYDNLRKLKKSKKEDIACRLWVNEVTTQTFERRQQTISEKIVQLNEEVIKGQIRELVRGKRGGGADLLRSPRRAPDAHPHKQRDRTAEP